MVRESDEQLRNELVRDYMNTTLYRDNAEFKLRLEFYQDVEEIKALLKQIIDKMG